MTRLRKTLLSTTLLACAMGSTTGAWAQAQKPENFIGAALGISVSAQQTKVRYSSTVASIDGKNSNADDSDISLIASWGFALTPQWVGTVGLSAGTNTTNAGSITYTQSGTQTISVKTKDHVSVSFAPGYRVGADSLVYAKVAYHQISGLYTDTMTPAGTTSHAGTGLGLGYAFAMSPRVELRAEYETVRYNGQRVNRTEGQPEQNIVSFAALYKF